MSRPLPRYRPDTDPHKLDRIIDNNEDTHQATGKISRRSAAGDEQRLRALPVCIEGVAGVIPGTDPHAALEAKERQSRRFRHQRINRA